MSITLSVPVTVTCRDHGGRRGGTSRWVGGWREVVVLHFAADKVDRGAVVHFIRAAQASTERF